MKSSRLRLEAARAHVKAARLDEAIALYEAVLRENPEVASAYLGIGSIHLKRKELAAAEDYFNGALHVAKNPAPALLRLAMVAERGSDIPRAVELYRRALQQDPGLLQARARLARLYLREADPRKAEGVLREGLEIDPGSRPVRLLLVRILQREGRLADAIELLDGIDSDDPSASARLLRGRLLLDAGRMEAAVSALEDFAGESLEKPLAELYRGRALMQCGRLGEARCAIESAVARDGNLVEGWLDLARCHLLAGEFDKAKAILLRLSAGRRGLYRVYLLLGEVFAAQGLYRQALVQFDAALLHASPNLKGYAGLVEAARAAGTEEERTKAFLRAAEGMATPSLLL